MITLFPGARKLPEHADKTLLWRGAPAAYTSQDMPTEAVLFYTSRAVRIDYDHDIPIVSVLRPTGTISLGGLYEFEAEFDDLPDVEIPGVGNFVIWSEELDYYLGLPSSLSHESRARQTKEHYGLGPEAYRVLCLQISEHLVDGLATHSANKERKSSSVN